MPRPRSISGWSGLGFAYQSQKKTAEARDAFLHAIAADPASLLSRIQLLRLEISLRLWEPASKTAEALIRIDTAHRYPEAHLYHGIATYSLHNMDAAYASLTPKLSAWIRGIRCRRPSISWAPC